MSAEQHPENKMISISRMLLTYPQCEETKESLLEHLKTLRNYANSLIARESHHETEGHHLHAFVRFSPAYKCRINAFTQQIAFNGHTADYRFLRRESDVIKAIKYVQKDGDILNDGIALDAAKHSRKYDTKRILTTDVNDLVDEGAIPPKDYMCIVRAQSHYRLRNMPNPDLTNVRGIWLWGPSGTGKSYAARKIAGESYYDKEQNKWWDGYDGEETVVIDDMDSLCISHYLKRWGDRYACKGEIKGATIPLPFKRIIITSNYSIADLMKKEAHVGSHEPIPDMDLYMALSRRYKEHEINSHNDSDAVIALYSHDVSHSSHDESHDVSHSSHDESHDVSHSSHDESHDEVEPAPKRAPLNLFASQSMSGYM